VEALCDFAHPGINLSGGFPSESIQFSIPYRIVFAATWRFLLSHLCVDHVNI